MTIMSILFLITEALLEVFGIEYCSSLRSLRGSHDKLAVYGVLSTIAYPGRKLKLITLNGRIVDNARIQQTIDSLLKASLINIPNTTLKTKGMQTAYLLDNSYLKP